MPLMRRIDKGGGGGRGVEGGEGEKCAFYWKWGRANFAKSAQQRDTAPQHHLPSPQGTVVLVSRGPERRACGAAVSRSSSASRTSRKPARTL
jgi:hypothetical protein